MKKIWWVQASDDLHNLRQLGGQFSHCCGVSSSELRPSERHGYFGRYYERGHLLGVSASDVEGITEQAWAIQEGLAEKPKRR